MVKVLVTGAGGAPSEGVIRSLRASISKMDIIGMGSDISDLVLSSASKRYLVPRADAPNYFEELQKVIEMERPDFIHAQNDLEVFMISSLREEINSLGVHTFLPNHETVETCVDKWKSYQAFDRAGVRVPKNIFLNSEIDLQSAFDQLSNKNGLIWLRSNEIAGGGKGALPTSDYEFARKWIDHHEGWGKFLAAETLKAETVTWLSIWDSGKLVVAQTRKRGGWVHGNRTLSGVTGVTKIGQTVKNSVVDQIAIAAVQAVDRVPHGIFGVDMAYDEEGCPNPTEINIGRFFTTIQFFTNAGLNMPEIYVNLGMGKKKFYEGAVLNPLPENLYWFRGMDSEPKLLDEPEIFESIIRL